MIHSHRQATWQCLHQRTAEEFSSCEFQTRIRPNHVENDIHDESITNVAYHCITAVIMPVENVHTTSNSGAFWISLLLWEAT